MKFNPRQDSSAVEQGTHKPLAGSSILPPGKKKIHIQIQFFMANTKSAAKRVRQNARNASRNASVLSTLRTRQKKLLAIPEGDKATIRKASMALSSLLDKAAKRGIIHRNLANRKKSRLPSVGTPPGEGVVSSTAAAT